MQVQRGAGSPGFPSEISGLKPMLIRHDRLSVPILQEKWAATEVRSTLSLCWFCLCWFYHDQMAGIKAPEHIFLSTGLPLSQVIGCLCVTRWQSHHKQWIWEKPKSRSGEFLEVNLLQDMTYPQVKGMCHSPLMGEKLCQNFFYFSLKTPHTRTHKKIMYWQ